jgi:hypothetical protein
MRAFKPEELEHARLPVDRDRFDALGRPVR